MPPFFNKPQAEMHWQTGSVADGAWQYLCQVECPEQLQLNNTFKLRPSKSRNSVITRRRSEVQTSMPGSKVQFAQSTTTSKVCTFPGHLRNLLHASDRNPTLSVSLRGFLATLRERDSPCPQRNYPWLLWVGSMHCSPRLTQGPSQTPPKVAALP